jgi:hypothetical protein
MSAHQLTGIRQLDGNKQPVRHPSILALLVASSRRPGDKQADTSTSQRKNLAQLSHFHRPLRFHLSADLPETWSLRQDLGSEWIWFTNAEFFQAPET